MQYICVSRKCNADIFHKSTYNCNTKHVEVWGMRKFRIPKGYNSTNKAIRFPDDVIEEVEKAICGTNCNFSQFVIEATRFALDNLEEKNQENKQE